MAELTGPRATQAKDFTSSASLKETMKKIGVVSPPDIAFLKVVEQKTY